MWSLIDPDRPPLSRQYASAIFYRTEDQREDIERTLDQVHGQEIDDINTLVKSLTRFHRAENYHQKYRLRQTNRFMPTFDSIYNPDEFTDSTVAARLNGFLSGYGSPGLLEQEWNDYGLPPEWKQSLKQRIES